MTGMKYRNCKNCDKNLPLTKEYFHMENKKHTLASGEKTIYKYFKQTCKKCSNFIAEEKRLNKLCEKLGCTRSEYKHNAAQNLINANKNRTADKFAKSILSKSKYRGFLNLKKRGIHIDPRNYDAEILKLKQEHGRWLIRTYPSLPTKYFTEEAKREANRVYSRRAREKLVDSYITNNFLGMHVNDVPKEDIELCREIIIAKKQINNEIKKANRRNP